MLTVETEVNMGTQRGQMKERGPYFGWFAGLVVPVQEILFCLGCSNRPSTNFFILSVHYFKSFVPISSSKLGRQPCWVACLLMCVSGLSLIQKAPDVNV
jgi:hypothetical protein